MRQNIMHTSGQGLFGGGQSPAAVARGRVLLVDDSDDVRRLIEHYLRATGAEVAVALNGRAACDAAFEAQNRRADFDLILLDMEMPELDGYGAATLLRMQGFAGPIIALTANDDAGERERCVASGCTEYLPKPVEREALAALVNRYLAAEACGDSFGPEALGGDVGGTDPGVGEFVRQFVASLPGYVERLEDMLRRQSIEQLAQTVHQIKGAAGMYGFDAIHDVAASAEATAKSVARAGQFVADGRRLKGEIDTLIGVIRETCGREGAREAGVARGE